MLRDFCLDVRASKYRSKVLVNNREFSQSRFLILIQNLITDGDTDREDNMLAFADNPCPVKSNCAAINS